MTGQMKRSHRRKSRRRSRRTRKRRGGLTPRTDTGVFKSGDLSLGKGAAAAVKKGVAAEATALKMCENITNQFARKICTEKVAKAQKKRAKMAKAALDQANKANVVAKKQIGFVEKRIGDIEKKIKAIKIIARIYGTLCIKHKLHGRCPRICSIKYATDNVIKLKNKIPFKRNLFLIPIMI